MIYAMCRLTLALSVSLLALLAGCGTAEPPAPAPTTASHLDEIDAALTADQKTAYVRALVAAVPAVQARVDRTGDLDKSAKYFTRDGARLCESIAAGESDQVIARQAALRFEVPESDGPAVREVTERHVCAHLGGSTAG